MNNFVEQVVKSPQIFKEIVDPYFPDEYRFFSQNLVTPYLDTGDAVLFYSWIRRYRPKKIIEIGCGFSTHFAVDAILRNEEETPILCIDPEPRTPLPKKSFVQHLAKKAEEIPLETFSLLERGDILFFDSSHTQLEAEYHVEKILPLLAKGVFIHHHDFVTLQDIVGPATHPEYEESRFLRGFYENALDQYRILVANYYIRKKHPEIVARFPESSGVGFGSLWIRKGVLVSE